MRGRANSHVRRLGLVLWALTAAGCAPTVRNFVARPRRICPLTTHVVLTWSVDGCASLSTDLPIEGLAEKFAPMSGAFSRAVVDRHADGTLKSLAAVLNPEAPRTEAPPSAPDLGSFVTLVHAEPRVASTLAQRAFANARSDAHANYADAGAASAPEMLFHVPHADTGKT